MLFLFLVVVLWVRKKLPTFPTDPNLEGLKKPSEGWKILKDCSHEKSKSISSYRRSGVDCQRFANFQNNFIGRLAHVTCNM